MSKPSVICLSDRHWAMAPHLQHSTRMQQDMVLESEPGALTSLEEADKGSSGICMLPIATPSHHPVHLVNPQPL